MQTLSVQACKNKPLRRQTKALKGLSRQMKKKIRFEAKTIGVWLLYSISTAKFFNGISNNKK